jgi:hypothetical protein
MWKTFILLLVLLGQIENTRDIWDSGFLAKRPSAVPAAGKKNPSAPTYAIAAETVEPGQDRDTVRRFTPVLGITVWRLRPAVAGDDSSARLLVQDTPATSSEFVAERLPGTPQLRIGDRVRLSIEAPQKGFLYIIDREQYGDGTRGDPYLIFPVTRLNAGDNSLEPGRVIEIPSQRDPLPAFLVDARGTRYRGEELLIIFSPDKIKEAPVVPRETTLPKALVESWEAQWLKNAFRFDQQGNTAVWTAVEKSAGASERLLTQDDPMPGSLYAIDNYTNGPVAFTVRLDAR